MHGNTISYVNFGYFGDSTKIVSVTKLKVYLKGYKKKHLWNVIIWYLGFYILESDCPFI